MKKIVDYFIYNYFLYIHKLISNRKSNHTATLGLVGFSILNGLDRIAIFSDRCYRFGLNIMLKPIQTDPQTPLADIASRSRGATIGLVYDLYHIARSIVTQNRR